MNFSSLFMETMTIREIVDNFETDNKPLVFDYSKLPDFLKMFKGCK